MSGEAGGGRRGGGLWRKRLRDLEWRRAGNRGGTLRTCQTGDRWGEERERLLCWGPGGWGWTAREAKRGNEEVGLGHGNPGRLGVQQED